jgi:two-component system, chemotaxis family, CheB/CheR fusion protein
MGKSKKPLPRSSSPSSDPASVELLDADDMPAIETPACLAPAMVHSSEDDLPAIGTFPVVAVGASAGGFEAFKELLQHLPANTGISFVFIQHLSPHSTSMLPSLLSRATIMPVVEVLQGMILEPDHIYVIPPNTRMSVEFGILKLEPRAEKRGAPRPIDHFLFSLAADRKGAAIGVILSGADSDGALGLQAIREEGGIGIVQNISTSKYPEMPRAALSAGIVDLILSPAEIGSALGRLAKSSAMLGADPMGGSAREPGGDPNLGKILALVRASCGADFRGYRPGIIGRRISRRMVLRSHRDLEAYQSDLESNPSELNALYEDILIGVTGFFRDPDTFHALRNDIIPKLLNGRKKDSPLRIWVPGCSTGEEVYSIAMCLFEALAASLHPVPIQIFGTDLSERNIAIARLATYPVNRVDQLSAERRARFFKPVDSGYQIVKLLREVCVFARQNLVVDPPFSRLDLISCRNLLIYLGPELQRKVIATLHFALRPGGYLVLGHSESLRQVPDLFSTVESRHRIYLKKSASDHGGMDPFRKGFAGERAGNDKVSAASNPRNIMELQKAAERLVLAEYGPAWVIVNDKSEIILTHGDTSPYIKIEAGLSSFSLLKLAREDIRSEIGRLLAKARNEDDPVQSAICQERTGKKMRSVRLEVRRIASQAGQGSSYMVLFFAPAFDLSETVGRARHNRLLRREPKADLMDLQRLNQELEATSRRMQLIIDERDSANQDLVSANEEIQSSNEELQSINEELETSKEELQSGNEELITLNEELLNRNRELNRLGDDLSNLLSSMKIPILMLDEQTCIRRVTETAEALFHILPSDIGRPVGDIRTALNIGGLEPLARRVMATLRAEEIELQDVKGHWHLLRVRPYRTSGNRIEGTVLALIDIDQIRRAREFADSIIESVKIPLLLLGNDFKIKLTNFAFRSMCGLKEGEHKDKLLFEICGGSWNLPELQKALVRLVKSEEEIEFLEVEQKSERSETKILSIDARRVQPDGENQILLGVMDITNQKRREKFLVGEQDKLRSCVESGEVALHEREADLLQSRDELRALSADLLNTQGEERRRISRELHDDLSQKLAKLQFDLERFAQNLPPGLNAMKKTLATVCGDVEGLSNDIRRIAFELHPAALEHLGLEAALSAYIRDFSKREDISVKLTVSKVSSRIPLEISTAFYRIVQEALRNIAKHAGKASAKISLAGGQQQIRLTIQDNGIGFDLNSSSQSNGLGLISMQERTRLIKGRFLLASSPGNGVTIKILVPLNSGGS